MPTCNWKVVGGIGKGGIIAREGRQLSSIVTCPDRVSTGSILEELELVGNRLRFRRLHGDGPDCGWVSITLQGKELVQKISGSGEMAVSRATEPPDKFDTEQVSEEEFLRLPAWPREREQSKSDEVSEPRNCIEEEKRLDTAFDGPEETKKDEPSPQSLIGAKTLAFYDAYDHADGYHYVYSPAHAGEFPLLGLSAGWLPAEVLDDHPKLRHARVRFDGGFWDSFEAFVVSGGRPKLASRQVPIHRSLPGTLKEKGKGKGKGKDKYLFAPQMQAVTIPGRAFFKGSARPMTDCRQRQSVELRVDKEAILDVGQSAPRPLLSILCIRWYDYWSEVKHSDYNFLNDGFFKDLFMGPGSVKDRLPRQYEVYSLFVRKSSDLSRLDVQKLRSVLKGENVIVWYFLWPSLGDNAMYEFSAGGFVEEHALFQLVHDMERLSVRTGWPHPAHLYRQLCGKLWNPQMCLNKEYRVPPTTRVHYADFKQDPRTAATKALAVIMKLRKKLWSKKEDVSLNSFRGVVKLGFSWGGMDVLPFRGLDSMIKNLTIMFETKGCQNTVCLVQELIPDVIGEHRVVCFWDERRCAFVKEPVWMVTAKAERFGRAVDDKEFGYASSIVCPRGSEFRWFFDGDALAWTNVEAEASRLVDKWLLWYKAATTNPPQVTRIDFLVAKASGNAFQKYDVWTCEVGECGASLCSVEVVGRNLAALNYAVVRDDSGNLPIQLPAVMPRNRGEKS